MNRPILDIERKGRSVLRKLSASGTVLLPVIGEAGMFGVYSSQKPCAKPHVKVSSEYVRAFLAQDWVETVKDGYILSTAGEAWLKRKTFEDDPFRAQHHVISSKLVNDKGGSPKLVKVNQMESPLEWLHRRKDRKGRPLIDSVQYKAGDKLRSDFTFAQLSQRVTAGWSPASGASPKRKHGGHHSSASDIRGDVIAAKERFYNALDYIGPEMSGIVVDVCCLLKGLEETEKSRGWPQRSGKVVLQIALTKLARHYGLQGMTGNPGTKTLHQGSSGCRPEF